MPVNTNARGQAFPNINLLGPPTGRGGTCHVSIPTLFLRGNSIYFLAGGERIWVHSGRRWSNLELYQSYSYESAPPPCWMGVRQQGGHFHKKSLFRPKAENFGIFSVLGDFCCIFRGFAPPNGARNSVLQVQNFILVPVKSKIFACGASQYQKGFNTNSI